MKLTEKWKTRVHSRSSYAMYGYVGLECYHYPNSLAKNRWSGIATIYGLDKRVGPIRKSIKAARQDAERLGMKLLRDLRDATKTLTGEDD